MVSEPRRSGRVPSSTTVTPGAATRWPIRPAKAEVPLRLKSPSSPWPTASCSITPGQPAPSTTVISPAGAGTASSLSRAWRSASSATASPPAVVEQPVEPEPAAAAMTGALAPAVALEHDAAR